MGLRRASEASAPWCTTGTSLPLSENSAVVKPYFEGLREKEEEAGDSGWDARKQKSEFLQRVSITIAKGNSRVLDCMRHVGLAIFHRTRPGH